ncbi:parasite porphobilinogen synthase PBGS [Besnoitia besnoiti]|uniref:Delta-aminolevulinic acid dehydratase n=1 Tax=Besnoitia besnoiti TaxID=94643 RepID=A0A2A9MBC5_BESBE|nr:parasite porphobilinogen synthase PBGS [Besnoitia besnoiti]PFH32690.1 parasite porphobilinogen synthase PBGS [Besnoitia besnoiti]
MSAPAAIFPGRFHVTLSLVCVTPLLLALLFSCISADALLHSSSSVSSVFSASSIRPVSTHSTLQYTVPKNGPSSQLSSVSEFSSASASASPLWSEAGVGKHSRRPVQSRSAAPAFLVASPLAASRPVESAHGSKGTASQEQLRGVDKVRELFAGGAKPAAFTLQATTSSLGRRLASSLRLARSDPEIQELASSPKTRPNKFASSSSCRSSSSPSCSSRAGALSPNVFASSFAAARKRLPRVGRADSRVGALGAGPAGKGAPSGGAKGPSRSGGQQRGQRGSVRGRLEEEDDEFEEDEDEDDEEFDEDDDDEDYEDGDEDGEYGEDEEYDPMTPRGPLDNNNYGEVWLPIQARPRRNRKNRAVRQLVQENLVKPSSLIYPLFVHDKETSVPIASMPGQRRLSMADLLKEVGEARSYGVKAFMLFPKVEDELKTVMAEESYNPDGIMPRAIMALKEAYPDILVLADVALDPYSSTGHDGVVDEETGKVVNDLTVYQLCKQALALARAGADMVCPSDMMDGRVSAIRESLDMEGCTDTSILAYSCKYASSFYGPFRDALDSHVAGGSDKKTYQMDPSNSREAEREAEADALEGADMLMVKPGLPYLDILAKIREKSKLPMVTYHVSGEYSMLKAAAEKGYIDEKAVVLEVLKSFRRAGADAIATYYAKEAAKWMAEDVKGDQKFTEPSY